MGEDQDPGCLSLPYILNSWAMPLSLQMSEQEERTEIWGSLLSTGARYA